MTRFVGVTITAAAARRFARSSVRLASASAALGVFLAWQTAPAVAAQHDVEQGVAMDVAFEPLGSTPTGAGRAAIGPAVRRGFWRAAGCC